MSTASSRSGQADRGGTSSAMPAVRIFRFARVSRWATVASLVAMSRAVSGAVSPQSIRRASGMRAASPRAGWQQTKTSRSRSSAPVSAPKGSSRSGSSSRRDRLRRHRGEVVLGHALAAQAVEHPTAGDGLQPGAGPVGDAVARPPVHRGGDRVGGGVLRPVEVAAPARQAGDQRRPVLTVHVGDGDLERDGHGLSRAR